MTLSWPKEVGPTAGLKDDTRGQCLDPEGFWMQQRMGFEVKTMREATIEYKKWLVWCEGKEGHNLAAQGVANLVNVYIHQRSKFLCMRRSFFHRLRWCFSHLRAPSPMDMAASLVMPLAQACAKQPPALSLAGIVQLEKLAMSETKGAPRRALPLLAVVAQILGGIRCRHLARSRPVQLQGEALLMWASWDKVAKRGASIRLVPASKRHQWYSSGPAHCAVMVPGQRQTATNGTLRSCFDAQRQCHEQDLLHVHLASCSAQHNATSTSKGDNKERTENATDAHDIVGHPVGGYVSLWVLGLPS